MDSKYKSRNSSIELARIIGCLIVIGVHTLLGYEFEDGWDISELFLAMVFADGVAVFWLITGAFIFNNNYCNLIKKSVHAIVVPMVSIGVIVFYLRDWILGFSSFFDSVNRSKDDYLRLLHCFVRWENGVDGLPHFWYLFVYLLLVLTYPIFKLFVDYLDSSKKNTLIFLIISFVLLVINDITLNELFSFSHHSINGLIPSAIITIWGHIIYKNRNILSKKNAFFLVVVFLFTNLLRLYIQVNRVNNGNTSKAIMYWFTSFGLVCSICIVCFCICIMENNFNNNINNAINYIGSYTMGIYLIHFLIRDYIWVNKIAEVIRLNTSDKINGFWGQCLFSLISIVTVFCVSFIIVFLSRVLVYLYKKLKKVCQKYIFSQL